jgi:hypothetical protein
MKAQSEQKPTSNDALGVETLTPEELEGMATITVKMLFLSDYNKSDAVLADAVVELIKLFKMSDSKKNRRFCLAIISFGSAAECASRRMVELGVSFENPMDRKTKNGILKVMGGVLTEAGDEET